MIWRRTIAARRVRRWVVKQALVAARFGKSRRSTLADIEALIQQSRQGSSANP